MNNTLIPIQANKIGSDDIATVSARDVHRFLGIGKDFSNWIKAQIDRAYLTENQDYVSVAQKGEREIGGVIRNEYFLTIDAAKQICMLSATIKGKQLREYFIECEKKLKEQQNNIYEKLSDPDFLRETLLTYSERVSKLEKTIQESQPKIQFYDSFANTDGLYNLQNAARALNQQPNLFIRSLKQKYLFYQGGSLVPYIEYRHKGFFDVKVTIVDDKQRTQTYITPKGLKYFAEKLQKAEGQVA